MIYPARTLVWLTVTTGTLLASFSRAEPPQQNSIPALLQFAEKYQEKAGGLSAVEPAKPFVSDPVPTSRDVPSPVRPSPRPGNWSIKAKELATQRATITRLTQEVSALEEQLRQHNAVKPFVPIDLKGVREMAREFRHALAITPDELLTVKKLEQANRESTAALKKEQTLLDDIAHLKEQNTTMAARLEAMKGQSQQQAAAHAEALRHLQDNSSREIDELKTALAVAKETQLPVLGPDKLNTEKTRQDYAAGISLGEEILQMQEERYRWGIDTDKELILAGIMDTFEGRRRLDDNVLNAALLAAEKQVSKAREETLIHQHKMDDDFLNTFKNRKAVKHTESGFWYHVDYEGDSAIPSGAIVDVVVKEMLTDGTVINDMETTGATLSQAIDDFPPLFKEAISLLKNHGSITMVIPPALAYGEKGYPPKVPPDATMVYQLRIAEMYPKGKTVTKK